MIVDDEHFVSTMLAEYLGDLGCVTYVAHNGEEAIRLFNEKKDEIDIVILDINMPIMDGIRFIQEVKETSFRFVPILVLSTETERTLKDQAKAAGAAGWLVKPFRPEQLLWVVKKFIR